MEQKVTTKAYISNRSLLLLKSLIHTHHLSLCVFPKGLTYLFDLIRLARCGLTAANREAHREILLPRMGANTQTSKSIDA